MDIVLSSGTASSEQQASSGARASIKEIRQGCLTMVRRRAWLAAAASFIPMPGAGMITDVAMLMSLIAETNTRFGLSEEAIQQLSPAKKALAYQLMTRVGGMLAARLSTSRLLGAALQRTGLRFGVAEAARFAPVIGQVTAASIAYFTLTRIARRHISQCVEIATSLRKVN
jgi:uncharacterized protein (DUF697 family)